MSSSSFPNFVILGEIKKFSVNNLINLLLSNRGIKPKDHHSFLNPDLKKISIDSVGIDRKELIKSIDRINRAIKEKEKIVVLGDYDVDGICGSAILWETLRDMGADVMPYIPNRFEEGYGLSKVSIESLKSEMPLVKLLITVDNGIVASTGVDFAKESGIDVIVTDHHLPGKKLPKAFSIVHTTKLCGAGVAYMLSKSLAKKTDDNHLELVILATIADLVPLTEANRVFVALGLEKLRQTKRPGLIELFKEAQIEPSEIHTYEIGHIIAPRLNAMGRMESALDSLRLICTTDQKRAKALAQKLGETNKSRQALTLDAFAHAKTSIKKKNLKDVKRRLIFVANESYQQGIIGLVAGRLTEEYYLPSFVVSKGKSTSKASARSVAGFNIVEFIREASEFLLDAGGHPMAAGFTFETKNLGSLEKKFQKLAEKAITDEILKRKLKVDCELNLENLSLELFEEIKKLEPFGMGNPTPVFISKNVEIADLRYVGKEGKHLKLKFRIGSTNQLIDGIWFGAGDGNGLKTGDKATIAYSLSVNEWKKSKKIELRIKRIDKN